MEGGKNARGVSGFKIGKAVGSDMVTVQSGDD